MNITLLVPNTQGTLAQYVEVTITLTLSTIWVIVSFQSKYIYPDGTPFWVRFGWPVKLLLDLLKSRFKKVEKELPIQSRIKGEHHW